MARSRFERLKAWVNGPATPGITPRTSELAAAIDRARRQPAASAMRRFDGAVVDRLTASWIATNTAIDDELRTDLDRLRARSRFLFKNNEHAAKFRRMVSNGIVGPEGFGLQVQSKDPSGTVDTLANVAIETAFWTWARKQNCDIAGRRGFVDFCRSVAVALCRDGEFLVRKVRGRNAGPYGYQLQLLDVDRLDTQMNIAYADGRNAVVMGVEMDGYRRPVAYHLRPLVGRTGNVATQRERVLASEIIHGFVPLEDEQTRGVPWLHAAMRILNDLKGYREAAVIAARIGASKMGIWVTPDGGPPPGSEESGTGAPALTDVSPGSFDYAPSGYTFKQFDPTYPHDQFDAFCKATLRGIAGAIGVAYNGLANDLEGVNFSSIRAGVLDERDEWMALQRFVIDAFLGPVFEDWLDSSLLLGAIRLPNDVPLPAAKRDKFAQHAWQGRRWQWVDPMKDIEASVVAIQNGLASPQQIAAQTGRDVEEILDDIARFQALAKAKNVVLPGAAYTPKPDPPPAPSE